MNRRSNTLHVEISRPAPILPTVGGGFAYFAYYRLITEMIHAELARGNGYIGMANTAETRAQLVEELSKNLEKYIPAYNWTVKVSE